MARSKTYEYEGETGSSAHLAELFGVSTATIRRKGKVVTLDTPREDEEEAMDNITLDTPREELLKMRECDDGYMTDLCNAFLQIKNIRKKMLQNNN